MVCSLFIFRKKLEVNNENITQNPFPSGGSNACHDADFHRRRIRRVHERLQLVVSGR